MRQIVSAQAQILFTVDPDLSKHSSKCHIFSQLLIYITTYTRLVESSLTTFIYIYPFANSEPGISTIRIAGAPCCPI